MGAVAVTRAPPERLRLSIRPEPDGRTPVLKGLQWFNLKQIVEAQAE